FKLDRTRWSGSGFDWTVIPKPGPGSAPRSEDYNVIEDVVPNAVVADLDGDGFKEIIFASYDGKVHAYWLDKTEHGSWPYTVPTSGTPGDNFRFASEPVVVDLDNDGHAEVIFASWPKKATGGVGQLHVLDYLGRELSRVDPPPPPPVVRFEETDPSIAYTSGWGSDSQRGLSGGKAAFSNTPNAQATFTFIGTSVSWIGGRSFETGIARVLLDGSFVAEVDTYAKTAEVQVPMFTAAGLANASHTLAIEATGRQNPAAVSAFVLVDAFDVPA